MLAVWAAHDSELEHRKDQALPLLPLPPPPRSNYGKTIAKVTMEFAFEAHWAVPPSQTGCSPSCARRSWRRGNTMLIRSPVYACVQRAALLRLTLICAAWPISWRGVRVKWWFFDD